MTPENRILLEKNFSEISNNYLDDVATENAALQEDNAKLENEIRELKAFNIELKASNTELKAENEELIIHVEKVEKERDEYFTRLKTLAWETVHCVSDKSTTSLELSKIILKLSETIKFLQEDTQKWYKAFNSSQGMCLDFITQNRLIREQLHGVGKVTAF